MRAFFITFLSIWSLMHAYVLARLISIPFISQHVPKWVVIVAGIFFSSSYITTRVLQRRSGRSVLPRRLSEILEYLGANWVGILFLLFATFLAADVVTGFGFFFVSYLSTIRTAALCIAIVLIVIAFVQAARAPGVTSHEVRMHGLPAAADGTVLAVASDMHLGTMLGERWASARAAQIQSLKPDIVILAGDIFEAPSEAHEQWLPVLRQFQAPHGVYVVTGNHEVYTGARPIIDLFARAGFRVLHDEHTKALPGLIIAGVDDAAFHTRAKMPSVTAVEHALANRPPGAAVFISHAPIHADIAAKLGANLMLCGHTHNGQIWPFNYIVRRAFPLVTGRYDVNGLTVIVGRGTGTWGPRMRLWQRSELLRVVLKATDD